MKKPVDILLLSGEKSGDQLALQLIQDIHEHLPGMRIAGMGGKALENAGMEILVDNNNLAIIGFLEVIPKIAPLWRAWRKLKSIVKTSSPLVILVDYPGMNLRFAKLAKKHHCRVLYYVSPQIWAWKACRLKTIRRAVDHIAVFFPFEKTIYSKATVPCTVVGHFLAKNTSPCNHVDLNARKRLGFNINTPLVVICPGSRPTEIRLLLPILIATTQYLPHTQFALLQASSVSHEQLASLPSAIRIIPNKELTDIFRAADAGIVVSGTITLEAACHQLPMTVIYKISPFNYALAKLFIKTPYIALCNIVCQQTLVHELIQSEATAENIARHTLDLLQNPTSRKKMSTIFKYLPPASHAELIPVIRQLIESPH
jgi:lipid-A-disaccharide synthase